MASAVTFPQHDPGDEQPTLFPAAETQPKRCKACDTTRKSLCRFDADVAAGYYPASQTRPRSCLNRHTPETAEIPF